MAIAQPAFGAGYLPQLTTARSFATSAPKVATGATKRGAQAAQLPGVTSKPVAPMSAAQRYIQALPPAQQAAFAAYVRANAPAPVTPIGLPTSQSLQFASQRQLANEQYRQMIADNAFQRGQTTQGFNRSSRDLGLQYGYARENEPDQFVQRGILGSGIQHADLQRLNEARLRSMGDLAQQRAGALSAVDLAREQIERSRDLQLAQIEQHRLQALAQYAAGRIK